MAIMTLYPFYDTHDTPVHHRELRNFFETPPAGNYVSYYRPAYDIPSRHGARYWKVNLASNTMTEIISSGYNLYFERTSGSGALVGNFNVTVPSTIAFGANETFAVTFWVGLYYNGAWDYVNSYPAISFDRWIGVYETAGVLTQVEKINPCMFTQYVYTYRTIAETPAGTTAYTYFYYPLNFKMVQSRLENIDLELKTVVPAAKRIFGDGLVWIVS